MKIGDLIFIYGTNEIALVLDFSKVQGDSGKTNYWVDLLNFETLYYEDLIREDQYETIKPGWSWPKWHINHSIKL
tara:strand:+ start:725 stop:949 length:225 start_codon:yes stop_codon:yes gene_type:complete